MTGSQKHRFGHRKRGTYTAVGFQPPALLRCDRHCRCARVRQDLGHLGAAGLGAPGGHQDIHLEARMPAASIFMPRRRLTREAWAGPREGRSIDQNGRKTRATRAHFRPQQGAGQGRQRVVCLSPRPPADRAPARGLLSHPLREDYYSLSGGWSEALTSANRSSRPSRRAQPDVPSRRVRPACRLQVPAST